ncbi:MAG TPA: hypothetical protein PKI01_10035 [Bacteroidales bacterium]|nr:hypothetical protein [Bacteroidales bacterium]
MGIFDFFSNKNKAKAYGAFIDLGDNLNSKETLEHILGKSLIYNKNLSFANVLNNVPEGKIWIVENGKKNGKLSNEKKITTKLLPGFMKAYYCRNVDNVEFLITMLNKENIPFSFNFPFALKSGCVVHTKNPQSELNITEYKIVS